MYPADPCKAYEDDRPEAALSFDAERGEYVLPPCEPKHLREATFGLGPGGKVSQVSVPLEQHLYRMDQESPYTKHQWGRYSDRWWRWVGLALLFLVLGYFLVGLIGLMVLYTSIQRAKSSPDWRRVLVAFFLTVLSVTVVGLLIIMFGWSRRAFVASRRLERLEARAAEIGPPPGDGHPPPPFPPGGPPALPV